MLYDSDPTRYYLVLHENGIIKIVTPEDLPLCTKLSLASADSKPGCCCHPIFDYLCCKWTDLARNLTHRDNYGCFCFAFLKEDENGQITFERYNRWNEDVDYLYTARKMSSQPVNQPSQPSIDADEQTPLNSKSL